MKAKKRVSIITLFISVLACVGVFMFYDCSAIWHGISLAVFGSALLGFTMSLTEYFAEKQKAMEVFWDEAIIAFNILSQVKHFLAVNPVELMQNCVAEETTNSLMVPLGETPVYAAKKALISYLEDSVPSEFKNGCSDDCEYEKFLEDMYNKEIKEFKQELLETMDSYIQVAERLDLRNLSNAYGNMDFIFANRSIRTMAYNDIYNEFKSIRQEIRKKVHHFKIAKDNEGSLAGFIPYVVDLNDFLFSTSRTLSGGYEEIRVQCKVQDKLLDSIEVFRAKIYNQEPNLEEHIAITRLIQVVNSEQTKTEE